MTNLAAATPLPAKLLERREDGSALIEVPLVRAGSVDLSKVGYQQLSGEITVIEITDLNLAPPDLGQAKTGGL